MSAFLSLPNELLDQIFEHLCGSPQDLKCMRLTCKIIDNAVSPHIFRHVILRYRTDRPSQLLKLLEALANSMCSTIAKHARFLTIETLAAPLCSCGNIVHSTVKIHSPACEKLLKFNELSESIRVVLPLAIRALHGVASVLWDMEGIETGEPSWLKDQVVAGLSQISSLKALKAQINKPLHKGFIPIRFHSFPPLEELIIIGKYLRGDEWNSAFVNLSGLIGRSSQRLAKFHLECNSHIGVSSPYTSHSRFESLLEYAPPLQNLTHLTVRGCFLLLNNITRRHFQYLTSLSIKNGQDFETHQLNISSVWENSKDAVIIEPSADVWTGLAEEKIWLTEVSIDEPTNNMIAYLASYEGLQCIAIYRAVSYINWHSDDIATRFYAHALRGHAQTLETLEIEPKYEGKWCIGEHNVNVIQSLSRLKKLSMCVIGEANEAQNMNSHIPNKLVDTILTIALSLPQLKLLSLSSAMPSIKHNVFLGGPGLDHARLVFSQIVQTVELFGPLNAPKSSLAIQVGSERYQGAPLPTDLNIFVLCKDANTGIYRYQCVETEVV